MNIVDRGPAEDVIVIRRLLSPVPGIVGPVYVHGHDATLGLSYGELFFGKRNGRWRRIGGSGGAPCSPSDAARMGIPAAVARKLLTGRFACGKAQS